MRRGRIITAVTALAGAAVVGVPGAFAATPQQIIKDYRDNGRLDRQYSKADLVSRVRRAVEVALREKRLTMAESGRLLRRYEEALEGYTYLTGNE